jgi:hypothetical protein
MPRKWSPDEEALLRKLWPHRGSLKTHAKKFVGRSNISLIAKGKSLGLPARKIYGGDQHSAIRKNILKAFEEGFVGTIEELRIKVGASRRTVCTYVHEERRHRYFICDWVRTEAFRSWTPVYKHGPGEDVPKPEKQTIEEKNARTRENRRLKKGKINPFASLVSPPTPPQVSSERYTSRVFLNM